MTADGATPRDADRDSEAVHAAAFHAHTHGATWRMTLLFLAMALAGAALHAGITVWPLPQLLEAIGDAFDLPGVPPAPRAGSLEAWLATAALASPLAIWLAALASGPWQRLMRALHGAVLSYRDGDFSMQIATHGRDELAELTRLHNALGQALREQRQHLVQRELLLDTVVQHTPAALLLTQPVPYSHGRGASERITYANLAARQLFDSGRSLDGTDFQALLARQPAELREAIVAGQDSLFTVPTSDGDETFHLLVRALQLQGRPHTLHLLRRMTRELSRQEVASWKRVLRVMSHELNNSLAPISSLAHSGAELARRGDAERLAPVFASIGERASHLHGFIGGYAEFAKLPAPRPAAIDWPAFVASLRAHAVFRVAGEPPAQAGWGDAAQLSQALLNLLKNAHEAGGDPAEVQLGVRPHLRGWRIEVADRGAGISDAVLEQALLPFYSTKRDGTGLGLALAREIAEAHGGRIALAQREGGGVVVTLDLPGPPTAPKATGAAGAVATAGPG